MQCNREGSWSNCATRTALAVPISGQSFALVGRLLTHEGEGGKVLEKPSRSRRSLPVPVELPEDPGLVIYVAFGCETCWADAGTDFDASKNQSQTVLACGGCFCTPETETKTLLLHFAVIMGTPARIQRDGATLAMKIQQASIEELANEDVGSYCLDQFFRLQALFS
jgi:hypothetical protein